MGEGVGHDLREGRGGDLAAGALRDVHRDRDHVTGILGRRPPDGRRRTPARSQRDFRRAGRRGGDEGGRQSPARDPRGQAPARRVRPPDRGLIARSQRAVLPKRKKEGVGRETKKVIIMRTRSRSCDSHVQKPKERVTVITRMLIKYYKVQARSGPVCSHFQIHCNCVQQNTRPERA